MNERMNVLSSEDQAFLKALGNSLEKRRQEIGGDFYSWLLVQEY